LLPEKAKLFGGRDSNVGPLLPGHGAPHTALGQPGMQLTKAGTRGNGTAGAQIPGVGTMGGGGSERGLTVPFPGP